MTRHADEYTAVPGHDELAAMATAAVYSVLASDTWTQASIAAELEDMDATPVEVAMTFSVMAAAMLQEALGKAEARQLTETWTRRIAARAAKTTIARQSAA